MNLLRRRKLAIAACVLLQTDTWQTESPCTATATASPRPRASQTDSGKKVLRSQLSLSLPSSLTPCTSSSTASSQPAPSELRATREGGREKGAAEWQPGKKQPRAFFYSFLPPSQLCLSPLA